MCVYVHEGEGECHLQDAEAHATSTIALFLVAGCPFDYSHLSHMLYLELDIYMYTFFFQPSEDFTS